MTPETTTSEPRKPVGNLTDFIDVKDKNDSVEIEVVVQNDEKLLFFTTGRLKHQSHGLSLI